MAFDRSRLPDKLVESYKAGRCAVLVGAGASKGAGLPLWDELLERMITEGERHRLLPPEKAAEYRSLLGDVSKFPMVASGLKEDIKVYFDEFIDTTFVAPKPVPTKLHEGIVGLDNLKFALTTNYDTILERAYRKRDPDVPVCTFVDTGEVQRRLSKREFFILKAHGDATKLAAGIILTGEDYRRILYRERAYQSLLSAMFTMFTIIFIGASMNDPEIKLLLDFVADAYAPNSGPSHFAVMPKEEITTVEQDQWFKDLKVQLIPVSKADSYAETTEFTEALRAAAA